MFNVANCQDKHIFISVLVIMKGQQWLLVLDRARETLGQAAILKQHCALPAQPILLVYPSLRLPVSSRVNKHWPGQSSVSSDCGSSSAKLLWCSTSTSSLPLVLLRFDSVAVGVILRLRDPRLAALEFWSGSF